MHRPYFIIVLFSAILLAACSVQPPVPEDNYYRLPEMETIQSKQLSEELAVKRFVADGLHSERPLLYGDDGAPLQLKQYHYHYWVDSPPRLLQEVVISALRKSGVSKTIINYDAAKRSQYTLRGKIRKFEQFSRGSQSVVLIDVEFRLDDIRGNPLFIKDYSIEETAASSAPHDLVMAFGKGIVSILNRFITDWQASL